MSFDGLCDKLVNDSIWRPYHGWHDDHRERDGTPDYLPAAQQVRAEWLAFTDMLRLATGARAQRARCLQLGLGAPGATHSLLGLLFRHMWTVEREIGVVGDWHRRFPVADPQRIIHGDTNSAQTFLRCASLGPLDLLFIDAGHRYEEVLLDHTMYSPLVRLGGIVAFHDAVHRPQFGDGIGVWRLIAELKREGIPIATIGEEVGIAYYVR